MPKSEAQQVVAAQRVWLAVIGKHPGWNDHLDDIGLDTERLVAVKRHLYVESIGGAINAGAWEALIEDERDEGFSHTFFWRQPDGVVIGRMWSSSDGKGRQKYPMIACAMCRSLPFSFVAGPLLERLRRLERECREVSTASEVIGAADRTRAELRELASFAPESDGTPIAGDAAGPGSAAMLVDSGRLGDDGVGLKRVLYQLDREMGAYIRPEGSGTASRSRSVEVRGQHIRVPSPTGAVGAGDEHGGIGLWIRLVLTKVDPLVPIFAVTKDGRDWVDLIVGELGPTPLACLQSTTEAIPFVSDIPFTLDADVDAALSESIELSRRGEVVEKDPCFIDVPQDRLAPFLRPKRAESSSDPTGRTPLYLLLGAIVVVVLIVIVVLAMRGGGGVSEARSDTDAEAPRHASSVDSQEETPDAEPQDRAPVDMDEPSVSAQKTTTEPAEPDPLSTGESAGEDMSDTASVSVPDDPAGRREAFVRWCDLYEYWFGPFVRGLDERAIAADPAFAAAVRDAIAAAEGRGDALDPLISTPGRFRSMESLRESPSDSIYEPAFAETIAAGLGPIEAVRRELDATHWETRSRLARVLSLAAGQGTAIPEELGSLPAGLESSDGATVADAAARLAPMSAELSRISGALDEFEAVGHDVRACPVPAVAEAFAALSPVPGDGGASANGAAWLGATAQRAIRLADLGTALLMGAEESYPRVDPGLFRARLAQLPAPADGEAAEDFLDGWLAAVRDRTLYLLDPATDPRRTLPSQEHADRLRRGIEALIASGENAESRELAGMFEAFERAAHALGELAWNEATKDRVTDEAASIRALFGTIGDRVDAEERTRAIEAESYIAELRATDSVSVTASPVVDAAWAEARDAAIERFGSDIVGLSRAIDATREHLSRIETIIAPIEVDRVTLGPVAPMLAEAIVTERTRLLTEAVPLVDQASIDAMKSRYDAWREDISAGVASLGTLRDGVAGWRIKDERAASQRWGASWGGRQVPWQSVEPGIAAYTRALSSGDMAELVEIAGSSDATPGAVFVAWTRLDEAEPAWGSTAAQLESDRAVSRLLLELTETLPADRADQVRRTISRTATARWLRGVSVSDAESFSMIASIGADLPLDLDGLPPTVRFNHFVEELRRGLGSGAALDREALVMRAGDLAGVVEPESTASDWLSSFVDELAAREGREVDYRVVGPARAGWAVEPFDAGRVLRYSWGGDNEPRELTFRLVESTDAGVFYLCETEAPAWLLTGYALKSADADAILSVLPEDWDPIPDTRLGPRVWDWGRARGGRAIRVSRSWVTRDRGSDRPYYAAGYDESVGRPSEQHPIQRVSARAAAMIAATAGCRLPSESEWRAAYESMGRPVASADWNLRDRSFEVQREHTLSLGAGLAVTWPGQQTFGDGLDGVALGPDAESHEWADGVLWFSETGVGRERTFRHLIGNVAEFVLPGTGDPDLLTDRGGAVSDRVHAIMGLAQSLPVIGGSSLSAPSVTLDRAVVPAVNTGRLGYTDAGFRLAFSPGVEAPLVVVVSELLNEAPFLRMRD